MPAAAVIPAPIAYIKVVAVKKLVVGLWNLCCHGPASCRVPLAGFFRSAASAALNRVVGVCRNFTVNKFECSKQAFALKTLAWNKHVGPGFYFVGFRSPGND